MVHFFSPRMKQHHHPKSILYAGFLVLYVPVGLDKHIMTCIHHYSFIESIFTVPKFSVLHLFISYPSNSVFVNYIFLVNHAFHIEVQIHFQIAENISSILFLLISSFVIIFPFTVCVCVYVCMSLQKYHFSLVVFIVYSIVFFFKDSFLVF